MEAPNYEEEIKILKETNSELVQKVQHFKMKANQCENDKLYLMKENNDLRLKLARLQSAEAAQARALDSALQTASEQALSHLVQASTAVARTIDLAKTYMRERQNLEISTVRWSTIGGTPGPPVREKVHKVAPMMMGGRSIQPFVSLDRIPLTNNVNVASVNQNQNVTERALPLPMHILQDVYIPLRRIDASEFLNHSAEAAQDHEDEQEPNTQEAEEPEENARRESERMSEAREYDDPGLDAINEESENENDNTNTSSRSLENPLEGPSWLLDMPRGRPRDKVKFEPDSTTEVDESISNIGALRLTAGQSYSQSPILEPRRHRSPETGRLDTRAVPGCSQVRNDQHYQETRTNTSTHETRSSTSRYATPKSNVTVRRRSPPRRNTKDSPGLRDRSQELTTRRGGGEQSSGTPGQLDVGAGNEPTPSPLQLAFTPTVRRKRTSPLPHPAPPAPPSTSPARGRNTRARRSRKSSRSSGNRILKVLVPKIDIESLENSNSCDYRDITNTSTASDANRSEQETSNTENISKILEIKLSRSEINVSRNTTGKNESVASTSRISDNGTNISGIGANVSTNRAKRSENRANISGNGANSSETAPDLSEIASTSGAGQNQSEQSDKVKKNGKGRSKSSRKGKASADDSGDASPPKRRALCKSPSPNGSSDSVMDRRPSTNVSGSSAASDAEGGGASGGLRTRRPRKLVVYKEKSLNVKLRRI